MDATEHLQFATGARLPSNPAPSPQSLELAQRLAEVFPRPGPPAPTNFLGLAAAPSATPAAEMVTPLVVTAAHGAWLRADTGTSFIDLGFSRGSALLGFGHPAVTQAIREAAENGLVLATATTPTAIALAEEIKRRIPVIERVQLVASARCAQQVASELACHVTGRNMVLDLTGTLRSSGVTSAIELVALPFNNSTALEEFLTQHPEQVAAVITPAVATSLGVATPQNDFLHQARHLTSRHGALMILDEVDTGFRVHPGGWWGWEAVELARHRGLPTPHYVPDLFLFGKAIGGGLPLGALAGRAELLEQLGPANLIDHSRQAVNPLATAAGLATLHNSGPEVYARIDAAAQMLHLGLAQALADENVPHDLNRVGSMFSVFLGSAPAEGAGQAPAEGAGQAPAEGAGQGPAEGATEGTTSCWSDHQAPASLRYQSFAVALREQGVAVPPGGSFAPWFVSFAHDDAVLGRVLDAFTLGAQAAARVSRELPPEQ